MFSEVAALLYLPHPQWVSLVLSLRQLGLEACGV